MVYKRVKARGCAYLSRILFSCINLWFLSACSEHEQKAAMTAHVPESQSAETFQFPPTPEKFASGETKFNTFCSSCHGVQGKGTGKGPPLVHKIYEPNHHGDFAFQRAAAQGVRAHHWKFGNMPKVVGVSPEEVGDIIQYIRWLQQEAGIY